MLKYKSTNGPIVIGHSPQSYSTPSLKSHQKYSSCWWSFDIVEFQGCSQCLTQFKQRHFVNKALSGICIWLAAKASWLCLFKLGQLAGNKEDKCSIFVLVASPIDILQAAQGHLYAQRVDHTVQYFTSRCLRNLIIKLFTIQGHPATTYKDQVHQCIIVGSG